MYKLYTDKSEDFKCKIGVEGSNINETFARLVIESDDVNLMFEGKIDSDGNCVVPIKKLRNLIPEGDSGKMKLEVIAEDTFFSPWEDEYTVEVSKKVTVEMVEEKETVKESKVKVSVITAPETKKKKVVENKTTKTSTTTRNHGKEISKMLTENDINLSNFKSKIKTVSKLIREYSTDNNVKLKSNILDEIIDNLKY